MHIECLCGTRTETLRALELLPESGKPMGAWVCATNNNVRGPLSLLGVIRIMAPLLMAGIPCRWSLGSSAPSAPFQLRFSLSLPLWQRHFNGGHSVSTRRHNYWLHPQCKSHCSLSQCISFSLFFLHCCVSVLKYLKSTCHTARLPWWAQYPPRKRAIVPCTMQLEWAKFGACIVGTFGLCGHESASLCSACLCVWVVRVALTAQLTLVTTQAFAQIWFTNNFITRQHWVNYLLQGNRSKAYWGEGRESSKGAPSLEDHSIVCGVICRRGNSQLFILYSFTWHCN